VLLRCSRSPSIAPCHSEEPTPLQQFVVFVFCRDWSNQHKFGRLEVHLSLSGKRGEKSHLGTIILSAVSEI